MKKSQQIEVDYIEVIQALQDHLYDNNLSVRQQAVILNTSKRTLNRLYSYLQGQSETHPIITAEMLALVLKSSDHRLDWYLKGVYNG